MLVFKEKGVERKVVASKDGYRKRIGHIHDLYV